MHYIFLIVFIFHLYFYQFILKVVSNKSLLEVLCHLSKFNDTILTPKYHYSNFIIIFQSMKPIDFKFDAHHLQ